jgi:hypothetical protein
MLGADLSTIWPHSLGRPGGLAAGPEQSKAEAGYLGEAGRSLK